MYFSYKINAPAIEEPIMIHPIHYKNGTEGQFVIMVVCTRYPDTLRVSIDESAKKITILVVTPGEVRDIRALLAPGTTIFSVILIHRY